MNQDAAPPHANSYPGPGDGSRVVAMSYVDIADGRNVLDGLVAADAALTPPTTGRTRHRFVTGGWVLEVDVWVGSGEDWARMADTSAWNVVRLVDGTVHAVKVVI